MSYKTSKTYKQLAMMGAMMIAAGQDYFDTKNNRVKDKIESQEDIDRRKKCEKTLIEKAQAKRERKAAKLRKLSTRKEE